MLPIVWKCARFFDSSYEPSGTTCTQNVFSSLSQEENVGYCKSWPAKKVKQHLNFMCNVTVHINLSKHLY